MTIKGPFHHIHLVSVNPQITSQWYVQNLGAQIENEAMIRGSICFRIRIGEARLNISGLQSEETPVIPEKGRLVGINHFALTTDNIEGLMQQLKKNGVKIVEQLFTTSTGKRAFFIEGPDGVLIEIFEN